jgi:hypothetical protein
MISQSVLSTKFYLVFFTNLYLTWWLCTQFNYKRQFLFFNVTSSVHINNLSHLKSVYLLILAAQSYGVPQNNTNSYLASFQKWAGYDHSHGAPG